MRVDPSNRGRNGTQRPVIWRCDYAQARPTTQARSTSTSCYLSKTFAISRSSTPTNSSTAGALQPALPDLGRLGLQYRLLSQPSARHPVHGHRGRTLQRHERNQREPGRGADKAPAVTFRGSTPEAVSTQAKLSTAIISAGQIAVLYSNPLGSG
jgi:hypothetical protein